MVTVRVGAAVAALWSGGIAAQEVPLLVELAGVPAQVFREQPFEVAVVLACDPAWRRDAAVPLFQRPLDLPFHVAVPWLGASEQHIVSALPPPAGVTVLRVAVGDEVLPWLRAGERDVGGRRYEQFVLRCRWLPLAAGELAVAPVRVRCAFATQFEQDFLRGRQPVDRREAVVQSAAAAVAVRELPPPPPGYGGAVGEFTLAASCAVPAVRAGETFAYRLLVRGVGNLERLQPPARPDWPGFHVQGIVEVDPPAEAWPARAYAFDVLALRPGLAAVPPLRLVTFSPARGDYAAVEASAVPLAVLPVADPSALPPRVRELLAADGAAVAAQQRPSGWWWAVAALAAGLGGAFAARRRVARRRALAVLAAEQALVGCADDAASLFAAFERLLAARAGALQWADELWALVPYTPARARLRALHDELDAARFGGRPPARDDLLAAVRAAWPR